MRKPPFRLSSVLPGQLSYRWVRQESLGKGEAM
jgi:hypothetical protein